MRRWQLGTELYFHEFPFERWRGSTFNNGQEDVVQFSSGDTIRSAIIDCNSCFYGFENSLFI